MGNILARTLLTQSSSNCQLYNRAFHETYLNTNNLNIETTSHSASFWFLVGFQSADNSALEFCFLNTNLSRRGFALRTRDTQTLEITNLSVARASVHRNALDCVSAFSSSSPSCVFCVLPSLLGRIVFVSCVSSRGCLVHRCSSSWLLVRLKFLQACACAFCVCFCASSVELGLHNGIAQVTEIWSSNGKLMFDLWSISTLYFWGLFLFGLLTGPGCNRKPANCTLVRGRSSLPTIGGLSITDLRELKSFK